HLHPMIHQTLHQNIRPRLWLILRCHDPKSLQASARTKREYNPSYVVYTIEGNRCRDVRWFRRPGVFAPLVGALVFKTSGRLEESRQWVRFPYTPVLSREAGRPLPPTPEHGVVDDPVRVQAAVLHHARLTRLDPGGVQRHEVDRGPSARLERLGPLPVRGR